MYMYNNNYYNACPNTCGFYTLRVFGPRVTDLARAPVEIQDEGLPIKLIPPSNPILNDAALTVIGGPVCVMWLLNNNIIMMTVFLQPPPFSQKLHLKKWDIDLAIITCIIYCYTYTHSTDYCLAIASYISLASW